LGAIDLSAFDLDLDIDADADLDADVDVDTELESGTTGGWLAGVLYFFNFGKLPFMVIMSVVVISGWFLSISNNYYLGDGWYALATFIPVVFISLIIAKIVTTPLVPVFESLDSTVEQINYIGLTCKIRLLVTRKATLKVFTMKMPPRFFQR